MATRQQRLSYLIGGIVLMALGAFCIWKGFSTLPGEAAIRIPRQRDWSITEAKVIGLGFCALGVYSLTFLREKE
jgi:hypothetical protein